MNTNYELFEKYAVGDCATVEQFAEKYRKPDRFRLRDKYVPGLCDAVIASHKDDLKKYGITWISHHDSVTGNVVSFVDNKK